MDKYKKLVNNSLIFAIGNFGSKALQFILVPLYSYTLTTNQFGEVDVLTTLVSLLSPLVCLDIYDAVFRYALDRSADKKKVFNSGIMFLFGISIFLFLFFLGINLFWPLKKYLLALILLIVSMVSSLISNYARAANYVKQFAISGILNTFSIGVLNVLMLLVWKMGVTGYLLSMILGLTISSIYLLVVLNFKNLFSFSKFSLLTLKEMIIYSIPLIPNALAWWLNSSSDRFFILFFIGASANGLYAMANKIPNILNMLSNIFFQSWQMSVVDEFYEDNSKKFISNVFNYFVSFMFLCSIGILALLKPIFRLFINGSYYSAWEVTPLVLLAVIYSSFSAFIGTMYTASKKTVPIFLTTLVGAIVNIIASLIFVKIFGINGAALANVISFLVVSVLRYRDMHSADKLNANIFNLLANHIIFAVAVLLLFFEKNIYFYMIFCLILIIVQLAINKKLLFEILNYVKKRIRRKKI